MKTIATVQTLAEADAICAHLDAAGIRTFVPDQATVSVLPLHATAVGGIRIQVEDDDSERVWDILAEDQALAEATGMLQCPTCGSPNVVYENVSRSVMCISILLLGVPLLWIKRRCTCLKCGHRWKRTSS